MKPAFDLVYKYIPPERISILQTRKLRYSQLGVLNDIAEGIRFDSWLTGLRRQLLNETPLFLQVVQTLLDRGTTIEDSRQVRAFLSSTPRFLRRWAEFCTNAALGGDPRGPEVVLEIVRQQYGVLSLSRDPDNALMWAHYSNGHTGFVLGFDSASTFFAESEVASTLLAVKYGGRLSLLLTRFSSRMWCGNTRTRLVIFVHCLANIN